MAKKHDIFRAECTGEFTNDDGKLVTVADVVKNLNDLCDGENNPHATLWVGVEEDEVELQVESITLKDGWITVRFDENDCNGYEDFYIDLSQISFEATEVFDMGETQLNFFTENEEEIEGVIHD